MGMRISPLAPNIAGPDTAGTGMEQEWETISSPSVTQTQVSADGNTDEWETVAIGSIPVPASASTPRMSSKDTREYLMQSLEENPYATKAMSVKEMKTGAIAETIARIKSEQENLNDSVISGIKRGAKIPFVSSLHDVVDMGLLLHTVKKEERKEKLDDDEEELLNEYAKLLHKRQEFDPGVLSSAAELMASIPSFAAEFATTAGAYKVAKSVLSRRMASNIAGRVVNKVIPILAGGMAQSVLMPHFTADVIRRQIPLFGYSEVDGQHAIDPGSGDSFARALAKASGASLVDVLSERTGFLADNAATKLIKNKFISAWLTKKGLSKTGPKIAEMARKAGWDGIVGELFEEQLAKPFSNLIEGQPLLVGYNPKQLAIEALGIGAFGTMAHVAARAKEIPDIASEMKERTKTSTANTARSMAENNWMRVLGMDASALEKAGMEDIVSDILSRGIVTNSYSDLQNQAAQGMKEWGPKVDEAAKALAEAGRQVETQTLIDDLEEIKNNSKWTLETAKPMEQWLQENPTKIVEIEEEDGSITQKEVSTTPKDFKKQVEQRKAALRQVQEAQDTLKKFGKLIRPDDLVRTKRFLDRAVIKGRNAFLVDPHKGFEAEGREAAANFLRGVINDTFPEIAGPNDEFHFYASLEGLADTAAKKDKGGTGIAGLTGLAVKAGKGGIPGAIIGEVLGGPGGGVTGAATGAVMETVRESPAWRSRMARLENLLAKKLGWKKAVRLMNPPILPVPPSTGGGPSSGGTLPFSGSDGGNPPGVGSGGGNNPPASGGGPAPIPPAAAEGGGTVASSAPPSTNLSSGSAELEAKFVTYLEARGLTPEQFNTMSDSVRGLIVNQFSKGEMPRPKETNIPEGQNPGQGQGSDQSIAIDLNMEIQRRPGLEEYLTAQQVTPEVFKAMPQNLQQMVLDKFPASVSSAPPAASALPPPVAEQTNQVTQPDAEVEVPVSRTEERRSGSSPHEVSRNPKAFEQFLEQNGANREIFSALPDQMKAEILADFGRSGILSLEGKSESSSPSGGATSPVPLPPGVYRMESLPQRSQEALRAYTVRAQEQEESIPWASGVDSGEVYFRQERIPLQELENAEISPMVLSDIDVSAMAGKAKTSGPIVLDADYSIIDGRHRIADLLKKGRDSVLAWVRVDNPNAIAAVKEEGGAAADSVEAKDTKEPDIYDWEKGAERNAGEWKDSGREGVDLETGWKVRPAKTRYRDPYDVSRLLKVSTKEGWKVTAPDSSEPLKRAMLAESGSRVNMGTDSHDRWADIMTDDDSGSALTQILDTGRWARKAFMFSYEIGPNVTPDMLEAIEMDIYRDLKHGTTNRQFLNSAPDRVLIDVTDGQAYQVSMDRLLGEGLQHLADAMARKGSWYSRDGKVSLARAADGRVKLGAKAEALGEILGASLYSKNPGFVIAKELMQNAYDAIRGMDNGKVTVLIDATKNSITVRDNGKGMTRHELETVFTDLGDSGKRGQADASGGFGLAKAAPLMMGKQLQLTTVTRDHGELWRYTMTTTPEELLGEGVTITSERADPLDSTGTNIEVIGKPDNASEFISQAFNFVETASKSIRPPGAIEGYYFDRWSGPEGRNFVPEQLLLDAIPLVEKDIPGVARIAVFNSLDTKPGILKGSLSIEVNNNGIYQFNKMLYIGGNEKLPGMPERIAVDIQSLVPEGNKDYPFLANRESVRDNIWDVIETIIQAELINPKRMAYRKTVEDAFSNLPMDSNGNIWFDSGGRLKPDELNYMMKDKGVIRLTSTIRQVMVETLKKLNDLEFRSRSNRWSLDWKIVGSGIKKLGIVLSDTVHGLNATDPTDKSVNVILINPFETVGEDGKPVPVTPDYMGALIFDVIKHEIVHDIVDDHDEQFTILLTKVSAILGTKFTLSQIQRIGWAYGDPNTEKLYPYVERALDLYRESRGREARSTDVLRGKTSRVSGNRPNDKTKKGDNQGVRPDRKRSIQLNGLSAEGKKMFRPLSEFEPSSDWAWLASNRSGYLPVHYSHYDTILSALKDPPTDYPEAYQTMFDQGWIRKNGVQYEVPQMDDKYLRAIADDLRATYSGKLAPDFTVHIDNNGRRSSYAVEMMDLLDNPTRSVLRFIGRTPEPDWYVPHDNERG